MEHTSTSLLSAIKQNPICFPSPKTSHLTDPNQLLEAQKELIEGFNSLIESLYKIGNVEHTNDWDLYATIKLNSGQEIHSATGYPELAIQGDKLVIQIEDEDDGKDPNTYIPLQDIATISISD